MTTLFGRGRSMMIGPWPVVALLLASLFCVGCSSSLPHKYAREAQRVTLTRIAANPDLYHGKLVVLGGVLNKEYREAGRLWIHVKNRPLDSDYEPQAPATLNGPEAGHYWVVIPMEKIPARYRSWARMTVVGQVTGVKQGSHAKGEAEPILLAIYLKGWSLSPEHGTRWEEFEDPQYQVGAPRGLHGEFIGQ